MKHNLLKAGILIFSLTLIINHHLKENTYYYIKEDLKFYLQYESEETRRENYQNFTIPFLKDLTTEEYYNILNSSSGILQQRIIDNTVKFTKPFELTNSLLFTIILCFSSVLIVFGIDFSTFSTSKVNRLLIFLPLIIYLFLNKNSSFENRITNKTSLMEIENSITDLDEKVDDLENNVDDFDNRISDLEY